VNENDLIWEALDRARIRQMVTSGNYKAVLDPDGTKVVIVTDEYNKEKRHTGLDPLWDLIWTAQERLEQDKLPTQGVVRGGINENIEGEVIVPDIQIWNDIFANYFLVKGIDEMSDRNTWQKAYTINVENVPYDVYQTDAGVVIPDPEDLSNVHFFEGGNVEEIKTVLTD
jgi:hypothetical protein